VGRAVVADVPHATHLTVDSMSEAVARARAEERFDLDRAVELVTDAHRAATG
jgi:hypothetical protein